MSLEEEEEKKCKKNQQKQKPVLSSQRTRKGATQLDRMFLDNNYSNQSKKHRKHCTSTPTCASEV